MQVAPPLPKRRARGVRPLSRLAEATRLALDIESDAVLTRIEIAGLNDAGLIRWNSFKNEVRMYFYSSSLVARYQQKRPNKVSRCGIRVTFKGAGPLDVGRAHLRCSRLRPVPTPSCSLAEILRRAHKQKNFPNGATPEKTMLRVLPTKRARPMSGDLRDGKCWSERELVRLRCHVNEETPSKNKPWCMYCAQELS